MILQGTKIIVVGAGIAGLAVARFLGLAGAQVHVIEQSPALRTAGAGIQISPNGARVLRALGLEPALKALGLRAQAVMLQDGFTGQMVSRATLGEDFYFLHRSDLLGLLADGARNAGVLIEFGQKLAAYDLTGYFPKIINANGQVNSASLIIGADGLHSGLRAQLNGASAPLYTGYVAWRALCDVSTDSESLPVAQVFMAPKRHLVSYPLRAGKLRNLVGVAARSSFTKEGWHMRENTADFCKTFGDFAPQVQAWLSNLGPDADVGLWGLFRHAPCSDWGRALPKGAVAILGDAAHPTLPFLAQGANLALEDAAVFARAFERFVDLGQALTAYQKARAARVKKVVEAARLNGRGYHIEGAARSLSFGALRLGGKMAANIAFRRYRWIYDYDAMTAV